MAREPVKHAWHAVAMVTGGKLVVRPEDGSVQTIRAVHHLVDDAAGRFDAEEAA